MQLHASPPGRKAHWQGYEMNSRCIFFVPFSVRFL